MGKRVVLLRRLRWQLMGTLRRRTLKRKARMSSHLSFRNLNPSCLNLLLIKDDGTNYMM